MSLVVLPPRVVQAEAGLRVEQGAVGLSNPLLAADAVAVELFDRGDLTLLA